MEIIKTGWSFFQNEIIGMRWLHALIGRMLGGLGIDTTGRIGGSIQFFIYDTIKIMLLLGVLIFVISYIQSFFPPERTKKILGRFHGIAANCIAALLGAGCASCHKQYENTKEAVKNLGLGVETEYITDMKEVMEYGVMSMPALFVNDKVVSMGKVLKTSEIEKLLVGLMF